MTPIPIDDADVTSAPLPAGMPIDWPNPEKLRAEIRRASAELMWALRKQRKAWAHMQTLKEVYKTKQNYEFLDNERPWKLAIGDVQWWRGEVSSRSNALSSMLALAAGYGLELGPQWAEATNMADAARGTRVFLRRDAPGHQ